MKKVVSALLIVTLLALLCALPALAETDRFAFDRSVTALFEGETLQTALIRKGQAAEGEASYVSSSKNVATVDENGLVTGLQKGKTTITATLKTGKRSFRATITLEVKRRVERIEVNESRLSVYQPQDETIAALLTEPTALPVLTLPLGRREVPLQVTCEPRDASDRRVTVTSSDPEIVRVQGTKLTPKKLGECDVTIASAQQPEVIRQYRVLVTQPITKLTLSAESKKLFAGDTLPLTVAYAPENASVQAVTWSSSNERAATVDAQGVVTGVARGNAIIKATAADGSGRSATYQLTVQQRPESITLSAEDVTINVGGARTIKATVLPNTASDKQVAWSSSDELVARVSTSGRITPVGPGECVVTCRSAAVSEVSAQVTVTVRQLVTRVRFSEDTVDVRVGEQVQVFWQTEPGNATDNGVTLSSGNTGIATVDALGVIYGVKRGSCYVTAKAADGSGKQGRVKVNVLQPVTGVHMKNDTLRLGVDETVTATAVLEPSNASNTRMTWTSADATIATVTGSRNKPKITGRSWGETTITGVTEDGGYATTLTVKVGNYDRAAEITDLYLAAGSKIKIVVKNQSNMVITRFNFEIWTYDYMNNPVPCNSTDGSNHFSGAYTRTLYPGESTEHGKFTFYDFQQPADIGRVVMRLTGYRTDDGYSRDIREDRQQEISFGGFMDVEERQRGLRPLWTP